jgi:protein import protein ZIM17
MNGGLCNSYATTAPKRRDQSIRRIKSLSLRARPALVNARARRPSNMSFAITAAPRLAPRATTASVRATSNARASCSVAATAMRRSVGRAAARAGRPPAVVSRWSRRARDANVVDAWARTIARANVLGDGTARADDESDEDEDDEVADSKRASVQLPRTRRRVQMTFTCNKCEGRTMRMINPDVLERGTMWVQCGQCEVWHQVVDNLGLIFDFTGDYEELKDKIKNARRMKPDE